MKYFLLGGFIVSFFGIGVFAQPLGETQLMRAAFSGDVGEIRELIASGMDIEARNEYGETALMYAARGNIETTKELIAAGSSIDAFDRIKWTPLMFAIQANNAHIVRVLIEADAEANVVGYWGSTPLTLAIKEHGGDALLIISMLLAIGTDVNAAGLFGSTQVRIPTPLIMAASIGDAPLVRLLLYAGADVEFTNEQGKSALDFARNEEIEQILLRWKRNQKDQKAKENNSVYI